MICEQCGENQASLHLVTYVNGEKTEKNICTSCAEKMNMQGVFSPFSVGDLFNGFFKAPSLNSALEKTLQCSHCGMTVNEFKSTGRLGCANCYATFEAQILPIIKKVQGSAEHTGKAPAGMDRKFNKRRQIELLKEKINDAIQKEDYEQAAVLRDQIKSLEKEEV